MRAMNGCVSVWHGRGSEQRDAIGAGSQTSPFCGGRPAYLCDRRRLAERTILHVMPVIFLVISATLDGLVDAGRRRSDLRG